MSTSFVLFSLPMKNVWRVTLAPRRKEPRDQKRRQRRVFDIGYYGRSAYYSSR